MAGNYTNILTEMRNDKLVVIDSPVKIATFPHADFTILKRYRTKERVIEMGINLDKPHLWKQDIIQSVDLYNSWFMDFAPKAFRETRVSTAKSVEEALKETSYLNDVSPAILQRHPEVLPILRMSTCPPIARDRLVGLARVSKSLVQNMEDSENPHISPRMQREKLIIDL